MGCFARTRKADLALQGDGTLMEACLDRGLPVASSCQGRGACGKCLVRIITGMDCLPAPAERERAVLLRAAAQPDERLACQCRLPSTEADFAVTTGYW